MPSFKGEAKKSGARDSSTGTTTENPSACATSSGRSPSGAARGGHSRSGRSPSPASACRRSSTCGSIRSSVPTQDGRRYKTGASTNLPTVPPRRRTAKLAAELQGVPAAPEARDLQPDQVIETLQRGCGRLMRQATRSRLAARAQARRRAGGNPVLGDWEIDRQENERGLPCSPRAGLETLSFDGGGARTGRHEDPRRVDRRGGTRAPRAGRTAAGTHAVEVLGEDEIRVRSRSASPPTRRKP